MTQIAVLGLGNFGTALARNWLDAGHAVRGWTVEQVVYDSVKRAGVNEKYLPDCPLHGLQVSMDMG
jgi:glycerol-3-phosphate dehydrogenase